MRLIDADELLYEDITDENGDTYMVVHAPQIENAPTIEAVPVVHGEWMLRHIGAGHMWECSVCHKRPDIYVKNDTNFCPNCGARMKGGA